MRLITTIKPVPKGFDFIEDDLPELSKLVRKPTVLFIKKIDRFVQQYPDLVKDMSGVLVEAGEAYALSQYHDTLWTLCVKSAQLSGLDALIESSLQLIRTLASQQTQNSNDNLFPESHVGTASNIERLRQENKDLLEAKKLAEQSNQAKRLFLATMSHEVRTPMNAVIGLLDVFDQSNLRPDQQELLKTIRSSADMLLAILTDVLDFSKIEAGKLELENQRFSIVEAVKRVVAFLKVEAKQKQVELSVEVSESVPELILGDENRIKQIILNLCSNAIKFTHTTEDSPGKVAVRIDAKLGNDQRGWVIVSIEDNGIGIAKENIPKLFTPFTQVDAATFRKYGGTGLGLSICSHLIKLMNGNIKCESDIGLGACFTVELPFVDTNANFQKSVASEIAQNQELNSLKDMRNISILVAEDNPVNRLVIQKQMKKLGLDANMVNDGEEALEYWKAHKVDILFTDCHMPNMDGYLLSQKIRELEYDDQSRLPIIVVTADAVQKSGTEIDQHIDDYLVKPITLNRLHDIFVKHARQIPGKGEDNGLVDAS